MQITTNKSFNEGIENEVIIVTDKMKRRYPELKKVNMIQKVPYTMRISWDKAMKYADKLKLAGYSDWRLPTLKEAEIIVEIFGKEMKLTDIYWTSTEKSTSEAYYSNLYLGGVVDYCKKTFTGDCFCVR